MKKFEHKNKDERRRVLLSKNNELSYAFDNEKLPEENEAVQANGVGVMAKLQNMNKRVVAVVLAVVLVLGLLPVGWFTLRGKADEDDGNLKSVTLQVVANGTRLPRPVTIEPGVVADNVKNITIDGLPDGAEFVKAVLIDVDDVETEVKSVATYKSATYYSLSEESDFGTALAQGEEIVLIYSTKYWITTIGDGNGSYAWNAHKEGSKDFIWSEEDLEIKRITPNEYYSIDSISYKSGSSQDTLTVTDSAVTIPHSAYKGDIVINFPFTKVNGYKIIDTSYAQGLGNGGLADTIGKSTLTSNEYSNYFKTRNPPAAAAWDGTQYSKEFYIYSNSSSGGSNFQLNMFRINGEEFEVSNVDQDGGISKTLADGTVVKVEIVPGQKGMYWLANKPNSIINQDKDYNWSRSGGNYVAESARKNRTVYKVTATNVHSDLNVEYNFKEKKNRELIIKGLNGITQTAHAKEKLGNGPSYEYFFETSANNSNIYKAYYREVAGYPSANLYLYKVKPGYNPYTVTSELYYDGEYVKNGIVSGGGVGRPEEAIKNANAGITSSDSSALAPYRMFDSQWRKWGGYYGQVVNIANDDNRYNGSDTSGSIFSGTPFVLTEIGEQYGEDPSTPLWYGIALQENPAYNQQLYLNAHPYEFKIELDTDGGILADTDEYKNTGSLVIEQDSHSVENPETYLPTNEPTKEGYIFQYWELQKLDNNGNYVSIDAYDEAYQYQKADQFTITGNTLSQINGNVEEDNQRIRFKAVWAEPTESAKTTVFTEIYVQTLGNDFDVERGGKKYKRTHYSEETQMPGWVVLMNEYAPEHSKYYEKRSGKYEENGTEYRYTKLVTESKLPGDSSYQESNTLRIYYDLRVVSLSVKKEVKGKPKTTDFEISIKLTPDDSTDAVISKEQAKMLMSLSDNGTLAEEGDDLVYTKTFHKGDLLTISNIPYGWSYEVSEAGPVADESQNIKEDDFTTTIYPAASGELTKDTNIVVSNKGKNPGIETEKKLTSTGNDTYKLDLNAWATGESLTQMLEDTTALDIVIVVDQSGSMNATDVGSVKAIVKESDKPKTKWTVAEATSKTYYAYDKTDDKYYPVTAKAGPTYSSAGNSFSIDDNFHQDGVFTAVGDNFYYGSLSDLFYYENNKMHPVYFNTKANGANLSFTQMAYYVTLYYFINPSQSSVPNVTEGRRIGTEDTDFGQALNDGVVSLLGAGSQWAYKWTWPSWWGGSSGKTYTGDLYRQTGNQNGLQYTRDNGEVVQLGKDAVFTTDKVYSGYLYEERQVTRAEALQISLNDFVESVKDNAEAQGVDHRVSLIGFAGNEVPGYSTQNATYNNSGSFVTNNSYDYVNTGLFVDGTYKSYAEITNLRQLDANETTYINTHYYVYYNGSEWRPVVYSTTSNKWYIVKNNKHEPSSTVYVTRITSGQDNPSSNKYYFYEPEYAYLNNNDGINYYQKALQSVNDDGTVNDDLTKEISMIGAYGPTYTSFGMDMATQVFRYNPISDGENRKRIVIVFSDGAPGANSSSFDEGVAEESYADSRLLKTEYDADVYTVYLYGQNESPSEAAQGFMQKLSSNYEYNLSPVYNLNPEKAYLYQDHTKTTSVTAVKRLYAPSPSGGWYVFDPETMSGTVYKYSNGSYTSVSKTNLTLGETYYLYTENGYEPYLYDYLWYDSAGYIAMPKTSEEDADNSHKQFYELIASEVDTEDAFYYQEAQSAQALIETFKHITETLHLPTTTVTLDASNSFMHDVVTADFDLPMDGNNVDLTKFSAQVVPAESIDSDGKITWAQSGEPFELSSDNLEVTINGDGTKTIIVKNFDYGENYTTEGHLGSKLVVTIQGLTPAEGTIGTVESNTDTSGIYWENDNDETFMVAEFEIPKVTIEGLNANVKMNYGGFNKIEGQKFPVTIKLTKSDGETPYTGKFGNYTFSSDGTLQTMMGDGDTRFFSDIPQKAKMTVTVADPDNASVYYTYSITGLDTVDAGSTPEEKELTVDITTNSTQGGDAAEGNFNADKEDTTREVKIDILDIRQSITVTNQTTGSYADYGHEFLFDVLITDANGHKFDGTILDTNGREVEINNGRIVQSDDNDMTLKLAHNQSRGFYVPLGFGVEITDNDPTPYILVDTETDTPAVVSISDDKATATAAWEATDTENHPGRVTFIHYIEDIVPTGIPEDTHNTNPIVWVLLGVVLSGISVFFFVDKRRRKIGEA